MIEGQKENMDRSGYLMGSGRETDTSLVDARVAENLPIDTTRPTPVDPEPIMQYFAFQHLPIHLQAVSALFFNLAEQIIQRTPRNPERSVALRKLLESKDAAVRAAIAK